MKKHVITHYHLETPKAPTDRKQVRLVFFSDLHDVDLGDHNRAIAREILRLKPDAVLCGGDLVVGKPGGSMKHGLALLSALSEHVPVYAANGNHEYRLRIYPETYGGMYEQYCRELRAAGVVLLENDSARLCLHGMELVLYGYELPREFYHRFARRRLPAVALSEVFGEPDRECYTILLAHHPKYFKAYAGWQPDLVLSGHYHGGLVRLFGDIPLIGNDFTLFPRFGYGSFREGGSRMVVTAGLGEHTLPLRIANPRELVVLDISHALT